MTTIKVAYVNHAHSERCGVHDLGRRHAQAIASAKVDVDYIETNSIGGFYENIVTIEPAVVIVNYMPGIMPWVGPAMADASDAARIAVIHNFQPDTLDVVTAWHVERGFDFVLALDPTLQSSNRRVMVTDRPLPPGGSQPRLAAKPRIGSSGFAFPHKDFPAVAREIAHTFDDATYALHMPEAYFNGAEGAPLFTEGILHGVTDALAAKPGLTLDFTDDYLPAEQLVARLARNHVNCLFYVPGQHNAGLSSQLDYLVAARRPIMVTDCQMFMHYRDHIAIFPQVRMAEVFDHYDTWDMHTRVLYDAVENRVRDQTAALLERVA